MAKRERDGAAAQALAMVRLPGVGERRPIELSGGQRQRVALARAIVNRPRVLLLDEPLGALDLKLREEMQLELKAIQRELSEEITFVYVTHDQDEALTMSDRIAVFSHGRIEQIGTPGEIWVSSPKVQAEQAISYGETPANTKACPEMEKIQKGSCEEYHANAPAAYFNSIKFWRTPVSDCGNGQNNCMDYSVWQQKWTEATG